MLKPSSNFRTDHSKVVLPLWVLLVICVFRLSVTFCLVDSLQPYVHPNLCWSHIPHCWKSHVAAQTPGCNVWITATKSLSFLLFVFIITRTNFKREKSLKDDANTLKSFYFISGIFSLELKVSIIRKKIIWFGLMLTTFKSIAMIISGRSIENSNI